MTYCKEEVCYNVMTASGDSKKVVRSELGVLIFQKWQQLLSADSVFHDVWSAFCACNDLSAKRMREYVV